MALFTRTAMGVATVILGSWFISAQVAHMPAEQSVASEGQLSEQMMIPISATFTLPILALHHIGPAPTTLSANAKTWYISEKKFTSLLTAINKHDLVPLMANDLLHALESGYLPERAILLTFDDGAVDFFTHAFPLLQEYRIPVTMHLQSHVRSDAWLSEDQIHELTTSGLVEFGSHTKYHQYLTRVSEIEAREELEGSKKKIEAVIGNEYIVSSLAYPFGLYNENVKKWANEAGYELGFTIDGGATQHRDNPMALKRIIITEHTNIEQLFSTYYKKVE